MNPNSLSVLRYLNETLKYRKSTFPRQDFSHFWSLNLILNFSKLFSGINSRIIFAIFCISLNFSPGKFHGNRLVNYWRGERKKGAEGGGRGRVTTRFPPRTSNATSLIKLIFFYLFLYCSVKEFIRKLTKLTLRCTKVRQRVKIFFFFFLIRRSHLQSVFHILRRPFFVGC